MSLNFLLFLLALAATNSIAAPPTLLGYAGFYILPMDSKPEAVNETYFGFYYRSDNTNFYGGFVCELDVDSVAGDRWCAFGFNEENQMIGSDAVIAYVASNGTGYIVDFSLGTQEPPDTIRCPGGNAVCPDTSITGSSCTDNVVPFGDGIRLVESNGVKYIVAEYSRPIIATDTFCDVEIEIGQFNWIVYAMGEIDTSDTWPLSVRKHIYKPVEAQSREIAAGVGTTGSLTSETTGTTGSGSSASTTGSDSTGSGSTTSGSDSTTSGSDSTTSESTGSGSTTSGSHSTTDVSTTGTTGVTPQDCTDLANKCRNICTPKAVTSCRCVNNAPVVECSDVGTAPKQQTVSFMSLSGSLILGVIFFWLVGVL